MVARTRWLNLCIGLVSLRMSVLGCRVVHWRSDDTQWEATHVAGFFSLRLAPGVRVSASPRGLRTHIGPRGARLHLGGGRTGISTGTGPFTYYRPLPSGRSGAAPSGSGRAADGSRGDGPSKAARAAHVARDLEAIAVIHRQVFAPATRPLADPPDVAPLATFERTARREAVRGVPWYRVPARRAARRGAHAEAVRRHEHAVAAADTQRRQAQEHLDEVWGRLLAGDPDTVLGVLAAAFEDNAAPAAAVGVAGDRVSVAVLVPPLDAVPERVPGTTAAGNVSLRRATQTQRWAWYRQLVAGHAVVAVKEAFAVAPSLNAADVVVLRDEGRDVRGGPRARPVLATRLTRSSLEGIEWDRATAWDIIDQVGQDTVIDTWGRAEELRPIDLADEPDLARLAASVDLADLVDREPSAPDGPGG